MPRDRFSARQSQSSASSASPAAGKSLDQLEAAARLPSPAAASPRTQSKSRNPANARARGEPRVPTYRLHRPSGRAVVTIAGQDHYLGTHGSAESRANYDRLVAEWLGQGRPRRSVATGDDLTVAEVVLAYWRYIKASYTSRTSQGTVAPTLRRLRRLYGTLPASEFGPRRLRTFQEALVQERDGHGRALSRRYINRSVSWVKRCFRWAVAEELVPPSTLHALQAVEPLRMGRTTAPETEPIGPVSDAALTAALAELPPVIADMVRVQRLTGMRPGELCGLRIGELDMSGEVWLYTPRKHKTAHRGKSRSIPIGPQARAILEKHLGMRTDGYLFSPASSESQRYEELRKARTTPLTPSQRKRDQTRAARRLARLGERYTTQAYALAIWRACDRAGIDRWSPNQLRHARATELRREFGLDVASAVLGHAKVETTQIYAERSLELAVRAAKATG